MDTKTRDLILGWVEMHKGDVEGLAKWMSRTVRLGGLRSCRALISEAMGGAK